MIDVRTGDTTFADWPARFHGRPATVRGRRRARRPSRRRSRREHRRSHLSPATGDGAGPEPIGRRRPCRWRNSARTGRTCRSGDGPGPTRLPPRLAMTRRPRTDPSPWVPSRFRP